MTAPLPGAAWYLLETLTVGDVLLDGDEGRHALVRRPRVGEQVVLTDGVGSWAPAVVRGLERHGVRCEVGPAVPDPPPSVRVVLVQGIPKGEAGVLAVDLATEAGVDEIVPWSAARSVARWDGKGDRATARWRAAARSAAKQARRAWVPPVADPAGLADVLARVERADRALVLHETAAVGLADTVLPGRGSVVLVVGPEGGVDEAELAALTAAGATAVRLGPQVLRSAVAAAVALGALGVLTDRWRVG